MIHELYIAPTARGLLPGRDGHCVVAATTEMPASLLDRLQELTSTRFSPADHHLPAVVQAHWLVLAGGKPYHVLGCIRPAGLDARGRRSCLAHYLMLEPHELPAAGPAWLLSQPDLVQTTWDGQVRLLPGRRSLPSDTVAPGPCSTWQQLTGDAGWAGILAQAGEGLPGTPSWLLYEPGQPVLPLFAESLALLPSERRWQVTFSTYFTALPHGVECAWRGAPRGSFEASTARRTLGAIVLDLPALIGRAEDTPLAVLARSLTPAGSPVAAAAPLPPNAPSALEVFPFGWRTVYPSRSARGSPLSLRERGTLPPTVPAVQPGKRWTQYVHRLVGRDGLLPFLAGCFVCGVVMALVLLVLSWVHYERSKNRLTSIEALDTQLSDKDDELRHLAAELHRHEDGIAQTRADLANLSTELTNKRLDSNQLATQLDGQRAEASRLKRELAGLRQKENVANRLDRADREKRAVVHDAKRLMLLYAALDKLDLGSDLHTALDCIFHGKPEDFETAFLHWYKQQALAEGAAQQLAAHLDFQAQANAEKEYLAAKQVLEKYRNSPGLTDVSEVRRLREHVHRAQARAQSITHHVLDACATLVQKYPHTLAAREVAQRPGAEAFCRKYAGLRAPFAVDDKDQKRATQVLQWLKLHRPASHGADRR